MSGAAPGCSCRAASGYHPTMPYVLAFVVAALLLGVSIWSGLWWAAPIVLLALGFYLVRERREGMATVTTSGSPQPTGMPRSASSGAETANERVGQV